MLTSILGYVLLVPLVLILIGTPLVLVLLFPERADPIVQISQTSIPWLLLTSLVVLFKSGISTIAHSIAEAIRPVKTIEAGKTLVNVGDQRSEDGTFSTNSEEIEKLKKQKEEQTEWAYHYYFKFLHLTIYGSQFELLNDLLEDGPKDPKELMQYYNTFLERINRADYKYKEWLHFLQSNLAVKFNAAISKYEITNDGKSFVGKMKLHNITAETFRY